jgi:hypothetical protein
MMWVIIVGAVVVLVGLGVATDQFRRRRGNTADADWADPNASKQYQADQDSMRAMRKRLGTLSEAGLWLAHLPDGRAEVGHDHLDPYEPHACVYKAAPDSARLTVAEHPAMPLRVGCTVQGSDAAFFDVGKDCGACTLGPVIMRSNIVDEHKGAVDYVWRVEPPSGLIARLCVALRSLIRIAELGQVDEAIAQGEGGVLDPAAIVGDPVLLDKAETGNQEVDRGCAVGVRDERDDGRPRVT